jgi:phage portal protein BeeE
MNEKTLQYFDLIIEKENITRVSEKIDELYKAWQKISSSAQHEKYLVQNAKTIDVLKKSNFLNDSDKAKLKGIEQELKNIKVNKDFYKGAINQYLNQNIANSKGGIPHKSAENINYIKHNYSFSLGTSEQKKQLFKWATELEATKQSQEYREDRLRIKKALEEAEIKKDEELSEPERRREIDDRFGFER